MPLISTGPISGSSDDTVRFSHDVDIVGGNLAVSGSISGSAVDSIFFGSDVNIVGGNLVCSGSIKAGTEGFLGNLEGGSVVNQAGADVNFRVESDDEPYMFFLDAGLNRISIGDSENDPEATLEITNVSVGYPGAPLLQLNNNDTNQIAVDINAANIDANVLDINADAVTTANIINITSDDAMTTGKVLHIAVRNGTTSALTPVYMHFDFDKDGIVGDGVTSTFTVWDIDLNDAATNHANANVTMTGLDLDIVSANAQGTLKNLGLSVVATGADTNTGLEITTTDASGPDVKIMSSADTGDYFSIATTTHGATTIATIDDDAAAANLTFDIDGHIVFEAFAGNEAVFNDGGLDVDFRVESVDETHMIFVEGSSNRVSIGDSVDAPAATLEITNNAAAGAYNVPLLQLNSNDLDQIAVDINANNTSANVIDIVADSVSTGKVINISADGLTTGAGLYIDDNSSYTNARSTVNIIQNHTSATGATALTVQGDGNGAKPAVLIDKNFTGTTSVSTVKGLHIDYDVTGIVASGQNAYHRVLKIDYNQNSPTMVGNAYAHGIDIDMVAGTSGYQNMIGVTLDVAGADANIGLYVDCPATSNDYHVKLVDDNDSGDFFGIRVDTHGATTIITKDDDAAAADLTFTVDGDISLEPAGGVSSTSLVITPKSTTNNTFNFGPGNNQNGTYSGSTGDMSARAGTVVGQIDINNLAPGSEANGNVLATGVLATDTIVATAYGSGGPGGPGGGGYYYIHITGVYAGGFGFAATRASAEVTADEAATSAQITFNWVAL